MDSLAPRSQKLLGKLLLAALAVVFLQVIIGGITRLTNSGLSITEWKVITGTFPPMSDVVWNEKFDLYKETVQYKEVNKGMSLPEFKFIFFWEWLHRFWGRVGFLVLLGIFGFFLFKNKATPLIKKRFIILLLLYAAQGVLGWFMVMSGLSDIPRVSHYRLTAHLLFAIGLFAYILWFAADMLVSKDKMVADAKVRKMGWWIVGVTLLQIVYGGFMSGLRAATHYPTFPDMNGQFIPENLFALQPFLLNFTENLATIHFIHRGIAYLLVVLIMLFWNKARKLPTAHTLFSKTLTALPIILVIQVTLGITILLTSQASVSVLWGAAHQAMGLILLSTLLFLMFQMKEGKHY